MLYVWNSRIKCIYPKQLVANHIEWNAACIRSVQAIFLHFDCWSWPLNGLVDLRYNLWGGKYEVCFNEIYWKSVSHHKISHLTSQNLVSNQLLSNAAHFVSIQGISTDLTFDLYMYLLTSDLNNTEFKTEAVCMKFTY